MRKRDVYPHQPAVIAVTEGEEVARLRDDCAVLVPACDLQ